MHAKCTSTGNFKLVTATESRYQVTIRAPLNNNAACIVHVFTRIVRQTSLMPRTSHTDTNRSMLSQAYCLESARIAVVCYPHLCAQERSTSIRKENRAPYSLQVVVNLCSVCVCDRSSPFPTNTPSKQRGAPYVTRATR